MAKELEGKVVAVTGGASGVGLASTEAMQIHVIADNLSTYKSKAVAEFLAAHPNTQLHYTPTYSSWLGPQAFLSR